MKDEYLEAWLKDEHFEDKDRIVILAESRKRMNSHLESYKYWRNYLSLANRLKCSKRKSVAMSALNRSRGHVKHYMNRVEQLLPVVYS